MIAMALKRHHISRSGARQIKKQMVESVLAACQWLAQTQALHNFVDEVVRSLHWRVLWPTRQSALFQPCQEITHYAQRANPRIDSIRVLIAKVKLF